MSYHDYKIYKAGQKTLYSLLRYSGFNSLCRYQNKRKLLVLTYHDVLTPGFDQDNPLFGMAVSVPTFEAQMKYLAGRYNVVSLNHVLDWLAGNAELPERPALITFDDGHRNNLTNAVPVLSELGLTAVFFVLLEYLGKCSPTWFEEIYLRIMSSQQKSVELIDHSVHPLGNFPNKIRACGAFFDLCRRLEPGRLEDQIQQLQSVLEPTGEALQSKERFEFLCPEDLQFLLKKGFHIGSHSLTHPILSTLSDERSSNEILHSCNLLEELLEAPTGSFAYPFGDWDFDYSDRDSQLVRKAGCSIAFSANSGFADRLSDPFNIPRMGIGAKYGMTQFQCRISGSLDRAKSVLRIA